MQKDNSLQRQTFVSLFEMFLAYKGIFMKPEATFIQKIKAAQMFCIPVFLSESVFASDVVWMFRSAAEVRRWFTVRL